MFNKLFAYALTLLLAVATSPTFAEGPFDPGLVRTHNPWIFNVAGPSGPGPGPVPDPWLVNGNSISYPGCIAVPVSVTGGCPTGGLINDSAGYQVNGVALPQVNTTNTFTNPQTFSGGVTIADQTGYAFANGSSPLTFSSTIPNINLAPGGAYTAKCNNTVSSATPTDCPLDAVTLAITTTQISSYDTGGRAFYTTGYATPGDGGAALFVPAATIPRLIPNNLNPALAGDGVATNGSTLISSVRLHFSNFTDGAAITGTDIPANTTIASRAWELSGPPVPVALGSGYQAATFNGAISDGSGVRVGHTLTVNSMITGSIDQGQVITAAGAPFATITVGTQIDSTHWNIVNSASGNPGILTANNNMASGDTITLADSCLINGVLLVNGATQSPDTTVGQVLGTQILTQSVCATIASGSNAVGQSATSGSGTGATFQLGASGTLAAPFWRSPVYAFLSQNATGNTTTGAWTVTIPVTNNPGYVFDGAVTPVAVQLAKQEINPLQLGAPIDNGTNDATGPIKTWLTAAQEFGWPGYCNGVFRVRSQLDIDLVGGNTPLDLHGNGKAFCRIIFDAGFVQTSPLIKLSIEGGNLQGGSGANGQSTANFYWNFNNISLIGTAYGGPTIQFGERNNTDAMNVPLISINVSNNSIDYGAVGAYANGLFGNFAGTTIISANALRRSGTPPNTFVNFLFSDVFTTNGSPAIFCPDCAFVFGDHLQEISSQQTTGYPADAIATASWSATGGGQVTFTTASPHFISVGEGFTISGMTPSGYNGNFVGITGTTGSTLVASLVSNPGTETGLGTLVAAVSGGYIPGGATIIAVTDADNATMSVNATGTGANHMLFGAGRAALELSASGFNTIDFQGGGYAKGIIEEANGTFPTRSNFYVPGQITTAVIEGIVSEDNLVTNNTGNGMIIVADYTLNGIGGSGNGILAATGGGPNHTKYLNTVGVALPSIGQVINIAPANSVAANPTGAAADMIQFSMPSCPDTSGNHLNWVSASGFTCGTGGPSGAVSSFSAGTTGFTPSTATSGAITLGGTLGVANGGTGITSFGTGIATFLGTPTSANLAAALTNETGSGLAVFNTSPTLVTPVLGAATATSVNGLTLTTSTGTLTIAAAKTETFSNTLTFTGTDGSSVAFGAGGTVAYVGSTGTVTSVATTGPITGGTITSTGTIACATCGVTGSPLSQFAATTSAQLAGVISDETGTGALVFATAPTISSLTVTTAFTATGLVTNADLANSSTTVNGTGCTLGSTCTVAAAAGTLTGATLASGVTASSLTSFGAAIALGTPASGVLTHETGLPLTTGVTGVLPVANGGTTCATATGTCLDNITGFASTGYINRTGAGTYTFTADPSDVTSVYGRIGAVVANSGDYSVAQVTGAAPLVSPSFTTPSLGVATATSINGLTISGSTGTFSLTNAKTLAVSNTLTFTGTDGSSVAFGAGGTVAYAGSTGTVTSVATTGPITGGTITSTGTIACATCGVTGSPLSQFAATTSAQLAGVISDETGTGALVFAGSPTLTGTLTVPSIIAAGTIADVLAGGATNAINLSGEGSTLLTVTRTSTDITSGNLTFQKAGGTIASRAAVLTNYVLGVENFQGYTGAGFSNGANITILTIDSSPSASSLQSSIQFNVSASGSVTPSQVLKLEVAAGATITGPVSFSGAPISKGSPPTNSGSCAINTQLGGNTAGSFKANGACAAGTIILAFATTTTNGYACDAHDLTTQSDTVIQTAYTATSASFKATLVTADLVTFNCVGF